MFGLTGRLQFGFIIPAIAITYKYMNGINLIGSKRSKGSVLLLLIFCSNKACGEIKITEMYFRMQMALEKCGPFFTSTTC